MLARVEQFGDSMRAVDTDGTQRLLYPTGRGIWVANTSAETGGGTGTPTGGEPVPGTSATIYNPWSNYSISGTWADHMSYSLGGIDYPLPYGTNLKAPAAGTLHTSGGTGEYQCGWVGSAGRRSILYLDTDFARINPTMEQNEGAGALHAIVFQHQSAFGTDGAHYALGAVCGVSGASANGDDYGAQVHLHVHGLNTAGQRVDLLNFIP
jgi:hypothetical protein